MGLLSPDPRSLCPLSLTEFDETPPPTKISGYAIDIECLHKGDIHKKICTDTI
jgi:hypothetical protein